MLSGKEKLDEIIEMSDLKMKKKTIKILKKSWFCDSFKVRTFL